LRGIQKPASTQAWAIPKPADTAGLANKTPSLANPSVVLSGLLLLLQDCVGVVVVVETVVSSEEAVMVLYA